MNITYKPAPKKVVAKKVMKAPTMSEIDKINKQIKMNDEKGGEFIIRRSKILDKYRKINPNLYSDPNFEMSKKDTEMAEMLVKKAQEFYDKNRLLSIKIREIKSKKVVAKKVMKTPAKKKMMKMVSNAKKDIMKKSMKKPIAFDKVEEALTGPKPRQVARFYRGGNVLPKGKKVPMPKKTTTTMKARKPMSAETKAKIKKGVSAYHKNCKKAMAMYSKMKK